MDKYPQFNRSIFAEQRNRKNSADLIHTIAPPAAQMHQQLLALLHTGSNFLDCERIVHQRASRAR